MKTIQRFFAVLLLTALSLPAMADNQFIDSLIGAAVGGGGARAICRNCNTHSRNIATAVGALGGAWVGSSVGDSTNQRFNPPSQPVYASGYRDSVERVVPVQTTYIREDIQPVRQAVRIVPRDNGCDEEYFRGQYNPELAHAYCEGRRQRDRQLQEAYSDGYSGR